MITKEQPAEQREQWRRVEQVFRGKYGVIRELEHGGQSRVYCARRSSDGKFFVLKHIQPGSGVDVEDNLRILSRLNHPQIPRLEEMKVRGEEAWLVQEFFLGDSLKKVLMDNRRMHTRLPWKKAVEWMLSACEPLGYLHSLQPPVCHCDVKPANLTFRVSDRRICLMDFDISREITAGKVRARHMSPAYASPEQKQLMRIDTRTDLYSLGVTFFQLCTNQMPGEHWLHWPLPPRFQDLLDHCMAPSPNVRFQTVEELRQELLKLL